MLTYTRLRSVLDYDPATGVFRWKEAPRGKIAGCRAGCLRASGYIYLKIDQQQFYAHRVAWLYMTGVWPKGGVDHVDTVRSNNAWQNLRLVSHAENKQNRRVAQANNALGILGVRRSGKRFRAYITAYGVQRYLGTFTTAEAASAAYWDAKRLHHPTAPTICQGDTKLSVAAPSRG